MTGFGHLTAEQRRAILAEELRRRSAQQTVEFPLSHGQKAMLALQQRQPESAAYNVLISGEIRHEIDVPLLQKTVESVVERHAVLRTTYVVRDGEPVQVVHRTMTPLFEVIECEHPEDMLERIHQAAMKPFDLSQGPILRAYLSRCAASHPVLGIVTHHIAVDFWSLVVLLDDLTEIYEALQQNRAAQLAFTHHTVAEFAENERALLEGPTADRLWEYWLNQLCGDLPVLEIPTDYPRGAAQSFAGDTFDFRITDKLAPRLRQVALSHGVTPYVLFASAFAVLLHRYSGQRDLLVASPMLARASAEWESVIGYLTNPVPLRWKIDPAAAFSKLLQQTKRLTLEALEFQQLPFPALTQRLGMSDLSRPPLCQAGFSWDRPHHDRRSWTLEADELAPTEGTAALQLRSVKPRQMGAPYELSVVVFEDGEQLVCSIQFNTGLFDAATIQRIARQFQTLLEGIAENADCAVEDLPLISEDERRELLGMWSRNEAQYPSNKAIQALFEAQVKRAPDALAVKYGETELTYRELNERANQLAHLLMRSDVRDKLVGVCLERSSELIVAFLAILKAGAAYLPLDADYPTSRLAFMLEDAGTPIVITTSDLRGRFTSEVPAISLDIMTETLQAQSVENPISVANGDSVAYVMYTSGSTGNPKGIRVPHRGISRLVVNTDYVSLAPGDRILQASNVCFDASTFEIWGALLNGAALIGFAKETMLSATRLAEELRSNGISTLFVTTALFHQLVREAPGVFGSVRDVLFGGEACDPGTVRSVFEKEPPARLLHVYGPTETTTFATWHQVRNETGAGEKIPIGLPIANTEAYVLDEKLRLVPVGVAGELFIGGDGVALGYVGREELTRERFVPNPFESRHPRFLYRTGDMVRRRADGCLEFLGRNDEQVKIHGFRIEPAEIESVLRTHPEIAQAVVVVRSNDNGEKQIIAYVAVVPGSAVDADRLRDFLKSRLAYYMIPAAIVMLDALPITANGKIDRNALPEPVAAEGERAASPPRNDREKLLVEIWQQALNVPRISIDDNFFELGGDSISVVRVVSRAIAAGIEITPVQVFEHQTVREIIQAVDVTKQSDAKAARAHAGSSLDFGWSASDLDDIQNAIRDSHARK